MARDCSGPEPGKVCVDGASAADVGLADSLDATLAAAEAGVESAAARHLKPAKAKMPFDTTPTKRIPPTALIAAAKLQILPIMASIDQTADPNGRVEPDGTVLMIAGVLVAKIRDSGHSVVAAEWAIHELIESGLLRVGLRWPDRAALPEAARHLADFDPLQPIPFPLLIVGSTESLWRWWRQKSDGKTEDLNSPHVRHPRNPDVEEVCRLLADPRHAKKDAIQVIRDFLAETYKDLKQRERKAQSLNRQARGFPHLWKPRPKAES
jgi:hypothetical protein